MKRIFPLLAGIAALAMAASCKKEDAAVARPKEQLIVGKWSINRVQVKAYVGSTLVKDSIFTNKPLPENFVTFDAAGNVEYRYNKATSDFGTYKFVGTDSVHATIAGVLYRWKNMLLTETNFNVINTTAYPSIPGATADTYQTFVR